MARSPGRCAPAGRETGPERRRAGRPRTPARPRAGNSIGRSTARRRTRRIRRQGRRPAGPDSRRDPGHIHNTTQTLPFQIQLIPGEHVEMERNGLYCTLEL